MSIGFFDVKKAVALDFTDIFDTLSKCPKLQVLNLSNSGMKVIPKNINKMKQIKELYLNSNGIKVLPEELFELTELNTLDLGVNSIKEITDGIKKLSKLKVLLLNSNFSPPISLRNLYNNIKNMPHLQKLHLWSCQSMMDIPEEIVEWKSLIDFDIDNNKGSILPNSIKEMAWLKRLRISNKSISEK